VPEVRFGELAHGQHFVWRGREWIKIGPLLAHRKGRSEPVMLRRSTLVTVKDGKAVLAGLDARAVTPREMSRLFQEIGRLTESLSLQESEKQRFLAAIRQRFLAAMHSPTTEEASRE